MFRFDNVIKDPLAKEEKKRPDDTEMQSKLPEGVMEVGKAPDPTPAKTEEEKLQEFLGNDYYQMYIKARELKLIKQMEIILLKKRGYYSVRRCDFARNLGLNSNLVSCYYIDRFEGYIDYNTMELISKALKDNIFEHLWIISASKNEYGRGTNLLVGEKFTSADEIGSKGTWGRKEYGYRSSNFWDRDTILMMICSWSG